MLSCVQHIGNRNCERNSRKSQHPAGADQYQGRSVLTEKNHELCTMSDNFVIYLEEWQ